MVLLPAAAGIIYLVWYSPVFVVKGIEFTGASLQKEEVNDLLGGDPTGSNILFWQPGKGHVLDPRFSSLEIKRNYLTRTIKVKLYEREKYMVWCFESNSDCYWTDRSGFIFSQAPLFSGSLIIVIIDSRDVPLEIGSYVLNSSMYEKLHGILKILAKLDVRTDEIRLEDIRVRELTVRTKDGPRIIFSLNVDPGFTETALASLMKTDTWGKMKSLNLTVPDRAYPSF